MEEESRKRRRNVKDKKKKKIRKDSNGEREIGWQRCQFLLLAL